jgi:macrophage erythroblast attacher
METLRLKRTTETLQWCSENRNHLRKQGSALEWHLRRQDFVELLRRGDKAAAVLYAKKHFGALLASSTAEHDNGIPGSDDNAQHQHEGVPQALALLVAVRPAYWPPPYSALMREDRAWQRLQDAFTDLFFSMYGLPRDSILPALVQCGCAAFKSPACRPGGHPDCPSCAPALESLVRPLPYAHYEYSRLLCRMSGAVMNEDNPPMALPNGQIYSLKV